MKSIFKLTSFIVLMICLGSVTFASVDRDAEKVPKMEQSGFINHMDVYLHDANYLFEGDGNTFVILFSEADNEFTGIYSIETETLYEQPIDIVPLHVDPGLFNKHSDFILSYSSKYSTRPYAKWIYSHNARSNI